MSGEAVSTGRAKGRAKLLLVVTSVAFSLWIVAMLIMYFKTVYPQRHPATQASVTVPAR